MNLGKNTPSHTLEDSETSIFEPSPSVVHSQSSPISLESKEETHLSVPREGGQPILV